MRVLVAGAAGVIGRGLVPRLVEAGHEVVGTTRRESGLERVRALGATAVAMDALDRDQVRAAVVDSGAEVVVHQLTAIGGLDTRRFDRDFAATNRLRTDGTDHLLAAARAAGVRRFVAQGVAGYGAYARAGGHQPRTEDAPLETDPPKEMTESLAAIRHLDRAVTRAEGIEGLVLRYGVFYGPGTTMTPGGTQLEQIRRGRFPLVGDAGGVWSFVHVDDAAAATALAVERGAPGAYNIVDDDPAPVAEWLPAVAQELGVRGPRRVPRFLGRVFAGQTGVAMMTEIQGADNTKARRELGWRPERPTWRGQLTRD